MWLDEPDRLRLRQFDWRLTTPSFYGNQWEHNEPSERRNSCDAFPSFPVTCTTVPMRLGTRRGTLGLRIRMLSALHHIRYLWLHRCTESIHISFQRDASAASDVRPKTAYLYVKKVGVQRTGLMTAVSVTLPRCSFSHAPISRISPHSLGWVHTEPKSNYNKRLPERS